MEVTVALITWALTILVPVHGLLFLGIRAERQRNRRLLIIRNRLEKRR